MLNADQLRSLVKVGTPERKHHQRPLERGYKDAKHQNMPFKERYCSRQDRAVTDFFLPNIVRVLDLSRGFFSGVVCFAPRPGRSLLSSAYLGL